MAEYLIIILVLFLSFLGQGFFISKVILIDNKKLFLSDIVLLSFFSL